MARRETSSGRHYLACGTPLPQWLLCEQARALAEIGAPYDTLLLSDLLVGKVPPYRLYVLADVFTLSAQGRAALRTAVLHGGSLALWLYAPGGIEATLTGQTMKALTGIDIAFLPMNLPYTMTPEMVADAALAFRPRVLYPYHTGSTDTARLTALLSGAKDIEVRVRKMP